jgi:hypothetical protein
MFSYQSILEVNTLIQQWTPTETLTAFLADLVGVLAVSFFVAAALFAGAAFLAAALGLAVDDVPVTDCNKHVISNGQHNNNMSTDLLSSAALRGGSGLSWSWW